MHTLKKLFFLLSLSERKRAGILMVMIVMMAILDTLGVVSILPFIAVLSKPSLVETNNLLIFLFDISKTYGVNTPQEFLFSLGILVFVTLVFSLSFKALTTYAQTRFALMREYSIGKRLVEGYLHQPYSWFLSRHSADLGKTILSEVSTVIQGGMIPLMTLMAQIAVASGLLILLLIVDPVLALSVGLTLCLTYILIFSYMSKLLKTLGEKRAKANQERFTSIIEAFSNAKELKVRGLEKTYTDRFSQPAEEFAKGQATAKVIGLLPRYILEAIAFGGMLVVILYLMMRSGSFANAVPIIALYAFAGYRLLPALQQIYSAFTQLRFIGPALDILYKDLNSLKKFVKNNKNVSQIYLNRSISLRNIIYTYPNSSKPALKNISIDIPVNSTTAFVGVTGSGKTTLVDLILGLLEPQKGTLSIDEKVINEKNRHRWQRSIGYVPQQIYLADASISANIAFGVNVKDIDHKAVELSSKIANLHDFINKTLSKGYDTKIGERGVRLSGGQCQRIGIARALYHKPKILVLDEATSALDNLTEQMIMNHIKNLDYDVTIIFIAHRLSTVRQCDQIYLFDQGKIKDSGNYEELFKKNIQFRQMAKKI